MLFLMGGVTMSETAGGWLDRCHTASVTDAAGAVLRAWRFRAGRTQGDVAALLDTTQQHLSQIEKGVRPVSLELRRVIVARLGIAPEELGLSSGQSRALVSLDDASPEIAASRMRWREERRWLNAPLRARPARRRRSLSGRPRSGSPMRSACSR
jgi:transcriptional regulator with XRE-family HTH domain